MRKKLLIDINTVVPYFALGQISGIGRTTLELVRALDKIPEEEIDFEIMLWAQNLKGIGAKELKTRFTNKHLWMRHCGFMDRIAYSMKLRERLTNYDAIHVPHNYEPVPDPSKLILTIHDVMFYTHPEKDFNIEYYKEVLPKLACASHSIITISECSKAGIIKYLGVPEEKITVIPWGIDFDILFPHNPGPNKYCGINPYFIGVSCSGGRKNTIAIVRAYAEFCKQNPDHHLLLVWANPTEEVLEVIEKNRLHGRVHFASNVPNEELGDLYAGATASFFPSLYEGFGLPILESMACGVPVVTCNNSSLAEVGSNVAIYVEPDDFSSMAKIMESFENGYPNKQDIIERGLVHSHHYTWEKCANATLERYKEIL